MLEHLNSIWLIFSKVGRPVLYIFWQLSIFHLSYEFTYTNLRQIFKLNPTSGAYILNYNTFSLVWRDLASFFSLDQMIGNANRNIHPDQNDQQKYVTSSNDTGKRSTKHVPNQIQVLPRLMRLQQKSIYITPFMMKRGFDRGFTPRGT